MKYHLTWTNRRIKDKAILGLVFNHFPRAVESETECAIVQWGRLGTCTISGVLPVTALGRTYTYRLKLILFPHRI